MNYSILFKHPWATQDDLAGHNWLPGLEFDTCSKTSFLFLQPNLLFCKTEVVSGLNKTNWIQIWSTSTCTLTEKQHWRQSDWRTKKLILMVSFTKLFRWKRCLGDDLMTVFLTDLVNNVFSSQSKSHSAKDYMCCVLVLLLREGFWCKMRQSAAEGLSVNILSHQTVRSLSSLSVRLNQMFPIMWH